VQPTFYQFFKMKHRPKIQEHATNGNNTTELFHQLSILFL